MAYTAHDLDDGLRSGMITPAMLEGITLWEIVIESVGLRNSEIEELNRHRLIRRLIGLEISDMVNTTGQRLRESGAKSVDDLQRLDYNVASFSEDMHRRNRKLKDFLYNCLYRHYRVIRMQDKAERVISDLFEAYQRESAMLPNHIRKRIDRFGLERTICDYIAGMTDRYAIQEHSKLFDLTVRP